MGLEKSQSKSLPFLTWLGQSLVVVTWSLSWTIGQSNVIHITSAKKSRELSCSCYIFSRLLIFSVKISAENPVVRGSTWKKAWVRVSATLFSVDFFVAITRVDNMLATQRWTVSAKWNQTELFFVCFDNLFVYCNAFRVCCNFIWPNTTESVIVICIVQLIIIRLFHDFVKYNNNKWKLAVLFVYFVCTYISYGMIFFTILYWKLKGALVATWSICSLYGFWVRTAICWCHWTSAYFKY